MTRARPYKGEQIDHKIWEESLNEYYRLHSWDLETGLQTKEGLEKLGLGVVANRLKAAGLIK